MDAAVRQFVSASPRRAELFRSLFRPLAVLGLVAAAGATVATIAALRSVLENQTAARLAGVAQATGELLAARWPTEVDQQTQDLVRRIAQQTGLRLTLLDATGRVLADSAQVDLAAVKGMESHKDRPEFVAALRGGAGTARRTSPTLHETLLYAAIRVPAEGPPQGIVRTATPIEAIEAQLAPLRRWAIGSAALLSATGLVIATWLARRAAEPLQSLAKAADSLSAGRNDFRLPAQAAPTREYEAIARALTASSKQLAERDQQLQTASQTQATVLEGMTECVVAVDRGERILLANAAAGRLLGFKPERVTGQTLLEAVRSHELHDVAVQALRTQKPTLREIAWRGSSKRAFEALAAPLPGDPPPGVVLVLRDISELKRAEQMRQQFIANVSHELKTPLSSIKAYAETLLGGARHDPVHCQRFLERIEEQTVRLQQLILDMLSLARIESGHAALELTSVPLIRVARRCLSEFEPQAAARHVTLTHTIDDPTLHVRAEEESLWQILSNLVDNAVKYTPPDGRVSIRCRRDGKFALLEVEDTGAGIPPEHHARLFERFYRVDKARSRELGGTGLGLSIVKHLCQAMGGTVSVLSEVRKGSTFSVRLPLSGSGS